MLRFILGVGSRVEHPTHIAGHCSEMLLSGILPHKETTDHSLNLITIYSRIHRIVTSAEGDHLMTEEMNKATYNHSLGAIFICLFQFLDFSLQTRIRERSPTILLLHSSAEIQTHITLLQVSIATRKKHVQ